MTFDLRRTKGISNYSSMSWSHDRWASGIVPIAVLGPELPYHRVNLNFRASKHSTKSKTTFKQEARIPALLVISFTLKQEVETDRFALELPVALR